MTWARIDDHFPEHPKVVGISDRAFRVHIAALCYAARYLTDGHIPKAVPSALGARTRDIAELVGAALWEPNGDSYVIHDYLDYNPSRAAVEAERARKATAGAKGAASRWGGKARDRRDG